MIRVQAEDFDPGFELEVLLQGRRNVGGVATFLGLVRSEQGDGDIAAMTLEHYPGMTEKMLAEIEAEANARWPLEASLVIHRHGRLLPGDRIVYVVTASAHRQAAYEANMFLVDWLKTKYTIGVNDICRWVTPNELLVFDGPGSFPLNRRLAILRSEVQHGVDGIVLENTGDSLLVTNVATHKNAVGLSERASKMLKRAALVEHVEHDDEVVLVSRDQPVHEVAAHEPAAARYQNSTRVFLRFLQQIAF